MSLLPAGVADFSLHQGERDYPQLSFVPVAHPVSAAENIPS
jgi:hypothetical protein